MMWLLVLATGVLQVWAHRNEMSPDGISYIELATASLGQGLHALTNAYWSPLYPFLIRVALGIFHPSMEWQFTIVHGLNLLVYLGSFVCFGVLLRELAAAREALTGEMDDYSPISPGSFSMIAGLLFLWAGQFWLSPAIVSPDLCVAALVYVATGMLLRIFRTGGGWLEWLCLGTTLGLAYLAKAAMFPLSFVFLVCAFLLARRGKRGAAGAFAGALLALAIFLIIAAPWINAISRVKGRWTFGDSGKIAYAEYVNGATLTTHWQGQPPGTGIPKHPTRQILVEPAMYEFAQPIPGSYPAWYDASYWYEGIRPHFALRGQLWVLFRALNAYFKMFSKTGVLYVVGFALFWSIRRCGRWQHVPAGMWFVMLPSIAALGLYALVLVEFRYVSPFALMLLTWTLSRVEFAHSSNPSFLRRLNFVLMLAPLVAIAWPMLCDVTVVIRNPTYEEWQVASGLRDMGVRPGAELGCIGSGLDAYWAHLANVRIVAEIPGKDQRPFIAVDRERKQFILERFVDAGAQAVVTKNAAVANSMQGWQRIRETQYYIWRPQ
jgi:4-amino-4-deoxy-L-arabinose transferase-like glycosyltransferase